MKANELRIGNWVDYKGNNVQWDNTDFVDGTACRISNPTPLTEEWLLKFGFKKKIDGKWVKYGLLFIKDPDDSWYPELGGDDWQHFVYVEYVHQLQNLYFSLTGEELKKAAPKDDL